MMTYNPVKTLSTTYISIVNYCVYCGNSYS